MKVTKYLKLKDDTQLDPKCPNGW